MGKDGELDHISFPYCAEIRKFAGELQSGMEQENTKMVREAKQEDLMEVLNLYLCLHEESVLEQSEYLSATWNQIVSDKNHHLIVNVIDGKIVSSCVCVIIPNLTRNVRPYAFVENVVTHIEYRGNGYATECLDMAKSIAEKNNCYKIMLLTGSKEQKILDFYKNSGYNCTDKTAFIQWISSQQFF